MIQIRRAAERGHFDHGWLNTWHTFSFGDYHDARFNRFRSLRVMNEDFVAPGSGFGMHPHRDMEIVTYILSGALEHKDSIGNGEVLRAGEFQCMSAGTGLMHSEFNPSKNEPVHLYQIWLFPERHGIEPRYEQKAFLTDGKEDRLQLVASHGGLDGSLTIHQDARIYLATLSPDHRIDFDIKPDRFAWLQALRGRVSLNDQELQPGDGAAIGEETRLEIAAVEPAEIMLFDLA